MDPSQQNNHLQLQNAYKSILPQVILHILRGNINWYSLFIVLIFFAIKSLLLWILQLYPGSFPVSLTFILLVTDTALLMLLSWCLGSHRVMGPTHPFRFLLSCSFLRAKNHLVSKYLFKAKCLLSNIWGSILFYYSKNFISFLQPLRSRICLKPETYLCINKIPIKVPHSEEK